MELQMPCELSDRIYRIFDVHFGYFLRWRQDRLSFHATATFKFRCKSDACLVVLHVSNISKRSNFLKLSMCRWKTYHLLMSSWSIQHLNLTLTISPSIRCLEVEQSKADDPQVSIRIRFATSLRITIIPKMRFAVYYTSALIRNFALVLLKYDQ